MLPKTTLKVSLLKLGCKYGCIQRSYPQTICLPLSSDLGINNCIFYLCLFFWPHSNPWAIMYSQQYMVLDSTGGIVLCGFKRIYHHSTALMYVHFLLVFQSINRGYCVVIHHIMDILLLQIICCYLVTPVFLSFSSQHTNYHCGSQHTTSIHYWTQICITSRWLFLTDLYSYQATLDAQLREYMQCLARITYLASLTAWISRNR